jgi:hypothetical protein
VPAACGRSSVYAVLSMVVSIRFGDSAANQVKRQ